MRGFLLRLLLLGAVLPRAQAAEFVPLLNVDILGGQFFYEGEHTSFSGNANLLASPSVKFSEKNALVPILSSQYRRTREVRELIGGGFLTQESLDTMAALKWIHQLDDAWAVKPSVSYKNELVTESTEEKLGNGLFDYHKVSLGLEGERRSERWGFRPSFNVYAVRYYHYRALSASVDDADLGLEVNSGDRVLDFNGYDTGFSVEHLLREGTVLSATFLSSARPFREQNLVTESGTYVSRKRLDLYLLGLAGVQQQLPETRLRGASVEQAAGLSLGYTQLLSNQNNYDASRTRFNPDYYDYHEITVSPFYAVKLAKKLGVYGSYDFARRRYAQRPVQTVDGNYSSTDDRIYIHTHTANWQMTYAFTGQLSLKLQGSYRLSRSNMTYESSYKYNYESAHYFVGLSFSL